MNKKILKILNTTYGQLIFSLLGGTAYFMVLLKGIIRFSSGQSLLAVWFAPLIICGAAIVIIKLMKQARANENNKAISAIFWLHTMLFIIGTAMVIAM